MRSLSDKLSAMQKAGGPALCKLVLTKSTTTKTYGVDTTNRILDCPIRESEWNQSAEVAVDNRDGNLTALNLIGYQGIISNGFTTADGDEYSPKPNMKVISQRDDTLEGEKVVVFSLAGTPNLLNEDHASADYTPDSSNTDTVKTIIDAVMGATLACFNHCTAYTVTWDSEDALIDVFIPADNLRIYYRDTRASIVKRLLAYTECVMRFVYNADPLLTPHVLVPRRTEDAATWVANTLYATGDMVIPTTPNDYYYVCTTGGTSHASIEPTWTTDIGDTVSDASPLVWTVAYDYEYTRVSTDHNFYQKGYRRRLVVPNKVTVASHPDDTASYTNSATDATSFALIPIEDFRRLRVTGTAQALAIAEALIAKAQSAAEKGHFVAPINVGQEIFDYVKVTDAWSSDYREGNVLYLLTHYRPGKFDFECRFGTVDLGGFVGTMPPQLTATVTQAEPRESLYNIVQRLAEYINIMAANLNETKEEVIELEERLDKRKGELTWVTLFDGSTDTPTAAAWGYEYGLPWTPTGQIWFSPIMQEVPGVYVIYVIDEAQAFWKYNVTEKHWVELTGPNYTATDAHRQLVPDDVDNPKELWCPTETKATDPAGDGIRLGKYDIGSDSWTDSDRTPFDYITINVENRVGTFSLNETVTGATSGATGGVFEKVSEDSLKIMPHDSATLFLAGEEIEGGSSGATADIKASEGFGTTPNWIYGNLYLSMGAFVYEDASTIWCWMRMGPYDGSAKYCKCVKYNPTSGAWTVATSDDYLADRFLNQRFGVSCAAINAAGTIVYGGNGIANDEYETYTIATDAYASSGAKTGFFYGYAYDKDKLWYLRTSTDRHGYLDISDLSNNDDHFAENTLRTDNMGFYFGVSDDGTRIVAEARSTDPILMGVTSGGLDLLGTIYSRGLTPVRVEKPADTYTVFIANTGSDEAVRTDETATLWLADGTWNVYYETAGDATQLLIQYGVE